MWNGWILWKEIIVPNQFIIHSEEIDRVNYLCVCVLLSRIQLLHGNSQQEVHVKTGEQPISDTVADSESSVEGRLSTLVQPEDLQLLNDHNLSNKDSSEMNPSPIPSTSQGLNFLH